MGYGEMNLGYTFSNNTRHSYVIDTQDYQPAVSFCLLRLWGLSFGSLNRAMLRKGGEVRHWPWLWRRESQSETFPPTPIINNGKIDPLVTDTPVPTTCSWSKWTSHGQISVGIWKCFTFWPCAILTIRSWKILSNQNLDLVNLQFSPE